MDKISLGYMSKYKRAGILKGMDDIQADIQIEYSGLLNSSYYNTISLGAEIKFLGIVSLEEAITIMKIIISSPHWTKLTYGIGLSTYSDQ
jgi:hypothetical protein